jgi:formylglycine-generating enzyme required for sulfatase activity
LFFDGFNFGSPSVYEKLTGKLGAIRRYNGLDIPSGYFVEAMERLSNRYLDVPLDAVLHPVSTEVRKVVKEEQIAVNKALVQKWEDIKELLKPAQEKTDGAGQTEIETATESPSLSRRTNLRLYGTGIGILLIVALGIAGVSAWIQNYAGNTTIPTRTSAVVTNTISVEPSANSLVITVTVEAQTPVATDTMPAEESTPTATPTLDIGSTMISAKDGMTLLYVPAGEFTMGLDNDRYETDNPAHKITLSAYWIDRTEVTNDMYEKCVEANVCVPPYSEASGGIKLYYGNSMFANFPVIHIAWLSASEYCEWVGRRLPTEAQWEKAARGATDERIYPWGDTEPFRDLANFGRQVNNMTAVNEQSEGRSPYGALNMAGNVWEWVSDFYDPDYYSKSLSRDPTGPVIGDKRVMRGGSWKDYPSTIRVVHRYADYPLSANSSLGFRCARDE